MDKVYAEHGIPPYEEWPQYTVTIRRNSDGAVVVRAGVRGTDDHGVGFYHSKDGNGGCDCNLHLDFLRGLGREADPAKDYHPCGDTAYSVTSITNAAGEVVYKDPGT